MAATGAHPPAIHCLCLSRTATRGCRTTQYGAMLSFHDVSPPPSLNVSALCRSFHGATTTHASTACVMSLKLKGQQLVVARNCASCQDGGDTRRVIPISPPLVLLILILTSISQRAPNCVELRIWSTLGSATCGFQVLSPTVKKLLQSR